MQRLQSDGRLYWGVNGTATTPMRKLFLSEAKPGMTTPSILPDMPLNQHAARELELIFGQKSVFDTPKPTEELPKLLHTLAVVQMTFAWTSSRAPGASVKL